MNAPTDHRDADARLAEANRIWALRARRTRRLLLAPALVVVAVFGLFPLTITLVYSVLEPGTYGGVNWVLSGEAYVQFLFERDMFDDTLIFST